MLLKTEKEMLEGGLLSWVNLDINDDVQIEQAMKVFKRTRQEILNLVFNANKYKNGNDMPYRL